MGLGMDTQTRKFVKNEVYVRGYVYSRSNGDHHIFINESTGRHITVPCRLNKMIGKRLVKEMTRAEML